MNQQVNRAWVFGDNVDTDQLAPGIYIKRPIDEISQHCLEALAPDFASSVASGEIMVAGINFGMGSSREQAAEALRHLGVRAIIAQSFGGIFYRNAINFGLLPLICAQASQIDDGNSLRIDGLSGEILNLTKKQTYQADPMSEHLLQIIDAGGLLPYLEIRLAKGGTDDD
jgi:3-isopropylmalate/(R)-2-methylmalate dehydratase small subunit